MQSLILIVAGLTLFAGLYIILNSDQDLPEGKETETATTDSKIYWCSQDRQCSGHYIEVPEPPSNDNPDEKQEFVEQCKKECTDLKDKDCNGFSIVWSSPYLCELWKDAEFGVYDPHITCHIKSEEPCAPLTPMRRII